MRVDARCNNPSEPDPDKDPGAALYRVPSNDDETQTVGRIRDGEAFEPACFVTGRDRVSDVADPANFSSIWIRVRQPEGYLPNVNVGGGCSEGRLRDLGLSPCSTE